MSRVLITGAAGFIGRRLRDWLSPRHEVFGVDTVVTDTRVMRGAIESEADVHAAISLFRPDEIYHLAALSHVPACNDDPRRAVEVNTLGTLNLLEELRCWNPERTGKPAPVLVIAGSGEEYGPQRGATVQQRLDPTGIYAGSKAAASVLAMAYARTFGLRVRVARFANVYGPGQDNRKFIPLVAERLLTGRTVELHNNGRLARSWLYVDDACAALEHIAAHDGPDMLFNVFDRYEDLLITAYRISDCLDALTQPATPYRSLLRPVPGGSAAAPVVMSRAANPDGFAWQPRVRLEDGIVLTVSAVLESHRAERALKG